MSLLYELYGIKHLIKRKMRRNKVMFIRYTIYLAVIGLILVFWPWPIKKGSGGRKYDHGGPPFGDPIDGDRPHQARNGLKDPPFNDDYEDEDKVRANRGGGLKPKPVEGEIPEDVIDWQDIQAIRRDKKRTGPGERGVPLNGVDNSPSCYTGYGYNYCSSDRISVDRSVIDIRHPKCAHEKYLRKLPSVSIIFPFYNEHLQTLMRSVHSVVNRSPKELLKEVILVDDLSFYPDLKKPLEEYINREFDNVRVIRTEKREGLIRARLLGARAATGEVLIFLDSHVEANYNWLPPLLDPIARDWKTVTCPMIDVVDTDHFGYRQQDLGARGAFDWAFNYKRLPRLPEDRDTPTKPFQNPIMAGGLFAIHAEWFWKLGGYDPGLEVWGGEQYEISFKVWQCGGQILDAPCSRVGHVFKKFNSAGGGFNLQKNYKRVAEVWMDEYKQFLYEAMGPQMKGLDAGELTDQHNLREVLQCKPFKWFIKNVAFDLEKYYPSVVPRPFAKGPIKSVKCRQCLEGNRGLSGQVKPHLGECMDDPSRQQKIDLNWKREIRVDGQDWGCVDLGGRVGADVLIYPCHSAGSTQRWKYNLAGQQLVHYDTNSCMEVSADCKTIHTASCDNSKDTQRWVFRWKNDTSLKLLWKDTGSLFNIIS